LKREELDREENVERIKLFIEKEEQDPIIQKEIDKAAKNYQIPGFRKGKAPRGMIKKILGEERLKSIAAEEVLQKAVNEMVDERDTMLAPIVEELDIDDNGNAVAEIKLFNKPEVTLPDYKDIEVIKYLPSEEDVEKMVDERIEELRKENALLEPKEGKVEPGDSVRITYFVKNEEGRELYNQEPKDFEVMEDDPRHVINNTIGLEAGEEKSYEKTFDKEAGGNKKGRDLTYYYTVKVEEVYNRSLPGINDDFAKEVKDVEGETVEELKKNIRQKVLEAYEQTAENSINQQIINGLAENTDIAITDETLDRIRQNTIDEMKKEQSYEKELEEYDTEEDLLDEIEKGNFYKLKEMFSVEKVYKENDMTISEEDINEYIGNAAPSWGMSPEQAKGFVNKDNVMKSRIEELIKQKKVAEFLKDKVTIEEKEFDAEEKATEEDAEKIIEEVEKTAEEMENEEETD